VKLFIEYRFSSLNALYSGQHWAKRKKMAHDVHLLVREAVGQMREPMGVVKLVFTPIVGKGQRKLDLSNYGYAVKLIEDGLVHAGVIKDDTQEYVKGIEILPAVVNRRTNGGMVVEVKKMDEDVKWQTK